MSNEEREALVKNLKDDLRDAYEAGKTKKYYANIMLNTLNKDNNEFLNSLIGFVTSETLPSGFTILWQEQCLDLSIEYIISIKDDGKYNSLFSDDIICTCKNRLNEYGFKEK